MPGDLKILGNWLEKSRRQKVEEITGTQIESPRRVEYSADLIFFDPDGQPKFSYYRKEDGGIDLFTLGRIHPRYGLPLEPVTPEIVQELEKADQNKRAAEQAKLKADEAEKQAERAEITRQDEAAAKAQAEAEAKRAAEEKARQEAEEKTRAEARAEAERKVEAARAARRTEEERRRVAEAKEAQEKRMVELQQQVEEARRAAERAAAAPVQSGQDIRLPDIQTPRFRATTAKLPAGTQLEVRLDQRLSTETGQIGEVFRAVLAREINTASVVLPVGTVFRGRIVELERPGRVRGVASVVLTLDSFTRDDQFVMVRTDNLTVSGETTLGQDAAKIGVGATIGAAIGAIVGGREGAIQGAGAGAGTGTVTVVATRGREINLEPEHLLVFKLAEDVSFGIEPDVK